MNDHIDPQRLKAAAEVDSILEDPEWQHIRQCGACMQRLAAGFSRKKV